MKETKVVQRHAIVLGADPFGTVVVPVEEVESVAMCVTLADETDEGRVHVGFGIYPRRGGGSPVVPLRLEYVADDPLGHPVTAVFDLDDGVIGRYEFTVDAAGNTQRRRLVFDEDCREDDDLLRRLGLAIVGRELEEWLRHPLVKEKLCGDVKLTRRRPGRRGSDLLEHALWAAKYVEALKVDPRRPAAVIVETEAAEGREITAKDVNNAITRARTQLGLLTPTERRRAGGELTETAKKVLRDNGYGHVVERIEEEAR